MNVRWTPEVEQDRLAIWEYLKARDPDATFRMDGLFSDAVDRLSDFPLLGQDGEIAGARELAPHRNYRLVYEIADNTAWVLALIHTACQWPPLAPS